MPAQKPHASIGEIGTTAKFTRNLLTPLRSVFEDALNDDLITFNPFERIALTKLLKQTASSSEYEVDPFTSEERSALIGSARADERAMVQFWFSTGLRPGELMALRWPKLDWVGRQQGPDRPQSSGRSREGAQDRSRCAHDRSGRAGDLRTDRAKSDQFPGQPNMYG